VFFILPRAFRSLKGESFSLLKTGWILSEGRSFVNGGSFNLRKIQAAEYALRFVQYMYV
jgi:hypothetical protein